MALGKSFASGVLLVCSELLTHKEGANLTSPTIYDLHEGGQLGCPVQEGSALH